MTEPELPAGFRASNADRERTADLISSAAAKGMLDLEEAGDRLGAVWRAKYEHDLAALTADLDVERLRAGQAGPGPSGDEPLLDQVRRLLTQYPTAALLAPVLALLAVLSMAAVAWAMVHQPDFAAYHGARFGHWHH